jgi:rhodanese-related sulfurtransferase
MLYILLSFLCLSASLIATAPGKPFSEVIAHKQINTTQLKSWYDQKKEMTIIDSRTKKYFSGTVLPGAKWLPVDSSENDIQTQIPDKNSVVVIYCYSITCPLSGELYDRLTALGYKNVYEYHEGLKEWINKGYPTDKH